MVNLQEKSPYFFDVGLKMINFIEDNELPKTLKKVYLERGKNIMKLGQFAKSEEVGTIKRKLDDVERKIFEAARKGA